MCGGSEERLGIANHQSIKALKGRLNLKESIEEYFKGEMLPHVPDAWTDHSKNKIGYEIPTQPPLPSLRDATPAGNHRGGGDAGTGIPRRPCHRPSPLSPRQLPCGGGAKAFVGGGHQFRHQRVRRLAQGFV